MEKQKRIYLALLICSSLLFITNLILHLVNAYDWWVFGILFISLGLLVCFSVLKLIKVSKLIKQRKQDQTKVKPTGNYNVDLYAVLGIPVQYNKDGSVKDIYELLGIEPIFDENGNRILTIYELLGVMPKFDSNGKEIPMVTVIKNRVGRIARVDVSDRVLTRKLTDEEKEALAIREMLTQKLKEAEEQGDVQKQKAIKSVIKSNKKNEAAPEVKTASYKLSDKVSDPLKMTVLKASGGSKVEVNPSDIFKYFAVAYRENLEKATKSNQSKVAKAQQEVTQQKLAEANSVQPETDRVEDLDNATKRYSSNVSVIIEEELMQ